MKSCRSRRGVGEKSARCRPKVEDQSAESRQDVGVHKSEQVQQLIARSQVERESTGHRKAGPAVEERRLQSKARSSGNERLV